MTREECLEHFRRFYDPSAQPDQFTLRFMDSSYLALMACNMGREDAFDDLVQRGLTSVDGIQNNFDRTLFSIAAVNRHMTLAKRILNMGANPETQDKDGLNAFHTILFYMNRQDACHISQILALHPDFIKTRSRSGCTCLHYDVSPEILRILLEAGAWRLINKPAWYRRDSNPVDRQDLSSVTESLAILVAYGGRKTRYDERSLAVLVPHKGCREGYNENTVHQYNHHKGYNTLMSRVRACGRVAGIVLGLAALRSPVVRGNGRDALRLVARMVWVYRVDEVWDGV